MARHQARCRALHGSSFKTCCKRWAGQPDELQEWHDLGILEELQACATSNIKQMLLIARAPLRNDFGMHCTIQGMHVEAKDQDCLGYKQARQ